MRGTVEWGHDDTRPDGHGFAQVATPEDLDTLLTGIEGRCLASGRPVVVHVYAAGDEDGPPGGIQIGVGYPDRSFAYWLDDDGGAAVEPDLEPGPAGARFDYGGQPLTPTPDELRVRPATARRLAAEYVRTGRRPTLVSWMGTG